MKTGNSLIVLVSVVASAVAAEADWPYWRGPTRDGRVAGFRAPTAWPATLQREWRTVVGLGDATPALADGRLVAFGREGEKEVISCLKPEDGRVLWRHEYPAAAVTGPAEKYAGPRSSPAVAHGRVITLGVGGVLAAVEVASGREVWRHEALTKGVTRFFTSVSPLIVDDCAIVHLGGKDAGVLFAVEIATGQVRWQWAGEGPAYASPAVGTLGGVRQVILQTESTLTGIAVADGRRLWQVPTAPRSGYWNSATPVVDGSVVYYSGQGTGTRAVQIERGGDGLQAREIWHNPDVGTVYNTPVLRDGFLFGLSPRGQFFCLEAATGTTRWLVNERVSNFGAIVDAGAVLVALPEKTGLIFFRPSAEKFDDVARHRVSDTPVYAHPVIAGDAIFIRDRDSVARWRLSAGEVGERK